MIFSVINYMEGESEWRIMDLSLFFFLKKQR